MNGKRFSGLLTPQTVLVTGGVGFVGTNLAATLLDLGYRVRALDNLSRPGVAANADFLAARGCGRFELLRGDVRDPASVGRAVEDADAVFHLAAQVAVTTSLSDPGRDFDVNARGTLIVLESIRTSGRQIPVLFTSTNKVYGNGGDLELVRRGRRYEPADRALRAAGIGEGALDFHTPYGCSKGTADQYVLDYARNFGLPATVFRMSCIYGPYQCGTEDQGWVAHFLIRMLEGRPIAIFGDGHQVRDVLFVADLVRAFIAFLHAPAALAGRAFNVGGGPDNAVSLLELLEACGRLVGRAPVLQFADWRPSDQRWYVSDCRRLRAASGWRPRTSVADGLRALHDWLVVARKTPAVSAGAAGA